MRLVYGIPLLRTAIIVFIITGIALSCDALTDTICNLRALGLLK